MTASLPLTILVADDDAADRAAVREAIALSKEPWTVQETVTAADLMTRLTAAPAHFFNCLILDFHLPDRDGFEVIRALRAADIAIPVVMLATGEDAELAVKLLKAGAADFIAKRNLNPEGLRQIILRAHRIQQAERERQEAQSALERSQRLLSAVVAQLPTGLVIADPATGAVKVNAPAAHILGNALGSATSLAEMEARQQLDPDPVLSGRRALLNILSGQAGEDGSPVELRVTTDDGRPHLIRVKHLLIRDEVAAAHVTVIDDVTDLRRKEEFQRHLMAIASHDLRNPLAAIMTTASVMHRAPTLSDDRRIVSSTRIIRSTQRMVRMIDDLFDYTLTQVNEMLPVRRTQIDLAPLLETLVVELRSTYPERDIQVTGESRQSGHWDPDRLHQLFENLVLNALNHGSPATAVTVEVKEGVPPDTVQINVHNEGPPIPDTLLPHIFEAYRRGNGTTPRSLGLGLYIARSIAEAHGGKIQVTSSTGAGTNFSVHLPRTAPQGEPASVPNR